MILHPSPRKVLLEWNNLGRSEVKWQRLGSCLFRLESGLELGVVAHTGDLHSGGLVGV